MRNLRNIRNIRISTSMGIAFTLLAAGLVVQATDQLALFGQKSVIPLLIGLLIIVVGVTLFLTLHVLSKRKKGKSGTSLTANDD